jgi:GT2 family glycosyltransferase
MDSIAVVIVNFNSGPLLGQCLDSLARQTIAPGRIVVVDNASSDGSERAAAGHAQVVLLREHLNHGFAAAMNIGISAARGFDWIATLNPDATAAPGWIEALAAATREHPGCGSFACRLLDAADHARLDGAGDAYHLSGLVWRRLHGRPDGEASGRSAEVFGACAAGALYSRAAIEACGGFDEDLFCYLEDVDLAFRLRLQGMRCLYLPTAVVHHVGSASAGRASEFQIYHGHRNLVWVFVKNMPAPLFWPLLPLHLLLNLLSLAWFGARGRGRAVWRAKRDALHGLPAAWRKRRAIQAARRVGSIAVWRVLDKGVRRGVGRGGDAE